MGSAKIGYAAAAHTGLNNAGGSNPNHALVAGLFHEYDADFGYRWHLLFDEDATGIADTDTTYGGPSLHALDGSGITGRVINMFFRVNKQGDGQLFNPHAGAPDLFDHSDTRINENLRVFTIRWSSGTRTVRLNRFSTDDDEMRSYWDSGSPPISELKEIWFLTEDDGLIKIDADWFDEAGSNYVRWVVPESETAVRDGLSGLKNNQNCLMVIADADSVGSSPNYIRTYDHGFYLQFKVGSNDLETKWLRPASYNPGVWHWVSEWEQSSSAPTIAGTTYDAAVYDVEGAAQYTADDSMTVHEDVARADQLGPIFVTYLHDRMDEPFREYLPRHIYPQDAEVVLSRRNIYRPRKFIFGRVESSSNKNLPLNDFDFREGARGNTDHHEGEAVGDDLLPLATFRPPKGTWRVSVDVNALTGNASDHLSIGLVRVNTEDFYLLGDQFTKVTSIDGFNIGEMQATGLAIDDDGDAFLVGHSRKRLLDLDLSTGHGIEVGTSSEFDVSEDAPDSLVTTENGKLFMAGENGFLYDIGKATGVGIQVGSEIDGGFGVGEGSPTGMTSIGNDVFMAGNTGNATFKLGITTGLATQIGDATNYGDFLGSTDPGIVSLFAIGDRVFLYSQSNNKFGELNLETGVATEIDYDQELAIQAVSIHEGVAYVITADALYRSNILDLPVALSEGVGVPTISRYNFPGHFGRGVAAWSVTGKLRSVPFYSDGTEDFSLVWNLAEQAGIGDDPDIEDRTWRGRDFKVFFEQLA